MSDEPNAMRVRAEDAEDLKVISAALQDAIVRPREMLYEPKARRFTATFNRYRWEREIEGGVHERVRAALQVGDVLAVKAKEIPAEAEDVTLVVLTVTFEPAPEPPGGWLRFVFAGGPEISVQVDTLDLALADLSRPWPTRRKPRHEEQGNKGETG